MDKGVSQMFCTDIQKDGKLQGPSIELYEKIINQFPTLNLIASGGVSSLDDLIELEEMHYKARMNWYFWILLQR
jgi:phosphoribosylformimino-5-aminoimidazole carboxamide ribotide isomerase